MGQRAAPLAQRRREGPEGSAGFSLLELVVVLFVLALAVGLVAPAISRSTDAIRLRAEVAGFAAVLRHAREQAITTRRPHTVVVDPVEHQMRMVSGEEVRRTKTIPEQWTVAAVEPSPLAVRFEPQGTSTGGHYRIVAREVAYRVTIDPLTGRVRSLRE
jgi:general secretion pathway protein H